jgi:outer membrane protein TolC
MNISFATLPLAALLLAGCATFSSDGGFAPVAQTAQERLGAQARWLRTPAERAQAQRETDALLSRPLSLGDALQIALLNNGSLQASFEELGISEADLVRAGRLPDPRFTLRHSSGDGSYDIEETVSVDVLALLTRPLAHAAQQRRFVEVQGAASAAVARLAARVRNAYFTALAARELARYRAEVADAAQTGAELARRMRAAGNWNALDEARERRFYLEAQIELERARLAESAAAERLIAILGLTDERAHIELAQRLPELPPRIVELPDVERTALDERLDLRSMRARLDALAADLKLTRATRFVNVLEAGPTRVKQGPGSAPYESGYEITLELPIFDGGGPQVRKAEARYAQAVDRFAQAAIEARAEVREAYAAYRAAHAIAARERDEVLPLGQSISEQDLERYNAAQISVFDLLADARSRIGGIEDYIRSVRDFWIAKSSLDAALLGPPAALDLGWDSP